MARAGMEGLLLATREGQSEGSEGEYTREGANSKGVRGNIPVRGPIRRERGGIYPYGKTADCFRGGRGRQVTCGLEDLV
eukprot:8270398-Pyramimonas_sp.AAC.1